LVPAGYLFGRVY